MSLIKQIVKPERFNSTELTARVVDHLDLSRAILTAVQLALDDLVQEGILSCDEEPKP